MTTSHLLRNLRRASRFDPRRIPKCLQCGERKEFLGLIPGSSPYGSLADESLLTGICSWECFGGFYGLEDDGGGPICRCGSSVHMIGSSCVTCQRSNVQSSTEEDAGYVYGVHRNVLSTS